MSTPKHRSHPGLIYFHQPSSLLRRPPSQSGTIRERHSSNCTLPDKCKKAGTIGNRHNSVGKIVLRSVPTSSKKTSVSIQTDQILEQQLQKRVSFTSPQVHERVNREEKNIKFQPNLLKIADQNTFRASTNQIANFSSGDFNKTMKKKMIETQFSNYQTAKENRSSQGEFSNKNKEADPTKAKSRTQKINQMTALYQKNLAKYQNSKGTLGILLKQGVTR